MDWEWGQYSAPGDREKRPCVFICIVVCFTCKVDNFSRGPCSIMEGLLHYMYW